MLTHEFADFHRRDLVPVATGEYPRIGHRPAPDHDRLAARISLHPFDISHRADISIPDNRNPHRRLDLRNRVPIGATAIALFLRAPVDGDQRAAFLFHDARHQFVGLAIVPSNAHLACDRDVERGHQLADGTRYLQRRAHHSHPCATVGDFLFGAAHVQVDNIRPEVADTKRRLHDSVRIIAIDLEDDRSFGFAISQLLEH